MIERIKWLGRSSFLIEGSPIIYINPWRVVRKAFHADIILITDDLYHHCSTADIEKLRGPHTRIISSQQVASQFPDVTVLRPWQTMTVEQAAVKAVPAYLPGSPAPAANGLGFIISLNLYDVYYTGITGITEEMARIRPDIVLLPIDEHDGLGVEDAVEVIKLVRPRWAIPYNWGRNTEDAPPADAERFRELVGDRSRVLLLSPVE